MSLAFCFVGALIFCRKSPRIYLAGFLLLLLLNPVYSQTDKIDSLKRQESILPNNTAKVDLYNELAMITYDYVAVEAFQYAQKALALASDLNYAPGKKQAQLLVGVWFIALGEPQKALSYYRQSLKIKGYPKLDGYGYNLIANVFRLNGQKDSANYYYLRSIAALEKVNDKFYLSIAYKNYGQSFSRAWQMEEALHYFQKSLKLRLELKDTLGVAENYYILSGFYINKGDYVSAAEWAEKGCSIGSIKNIYQQVHCHYYKGDILFRQGQNAKALVEMRAALQLLETISYQEYTINALIKLAEIYDDLGQIELGLESLFRALKLAEASGYQPQIANIYALIGWFYKNQKDFKTAWAYCNKSDTIYKRINDPNGLSYVFNIKGLIRFQEKDYDSAAYFLNESLAIRQSIGHVAGVAASSFNLALVFEEQRNFDKALEMQFQSLRLEEKMGNHTGMGVSYNAIAGIYFKKSNLSKAERFLKLADYEANYTQSKLLRKNTLELYSKLYERRGDPQKALYYHKEFHALNDSLYSESSAAKAAELRSIYELDQQQKQIELLNKQKELQQQEINQQRVIIFSTFGGVLLLVIAGFIGYRYYRIKALTNIELQKLNREIIEQKEEIQAQSEELVEANQIVASVNRTLEQKIEERTSELKQAYKELDTFFYRSSHDFRRPLTTFLGLAEVAKITVKDPNSLELFDKVKETAINLDRMLIKLQSISDLGTQQMVFKEVFIKELVEQSLVLFQEELSARAIQTRLQIEMKTPFYSYPALIKIILENIVENSIQFSIPENPILIIRAENEDSGLLLVIEDNGIGILPDYQERVFDMYFRANEKSKGNGLGLYIVKKAVQKLNGKISLWSEYEKGTRLVITLPTMMV